MITSTITFVSLLVSTVVPCNSELYNYSKNSIPSVCNTHCQNGIGYNTASVGLLVADCCVSLPPHAGLEVMDQSTPSDTTNTIEP